jgi:hypothetical protein
MDVGSWLRSRPPPRTLVVEKPNLFVRQCIAFVAGFCIREKLLIRA